MLAPAGPLAELIGKAPGMFVATTFGSNVARLKTLEPPLSHIEMMAQIARIIADCKPAMLIGYNTIRFDDEVLRQSFYQTLLPPYLGAMTGHGRADVLTMLRAVVMLEPDAGNRVRVFQWRDDCCFLRFGCVLRAVKPSTLRICGLVGCLEKHVSMYLLKKIRCSAGFPD